MADEIIIRYNKFIYFLKFRTNFVLFLVSLFSVTFILFHLIELNNVLGISEFFALNLLFQLIVLFCTIYAITVLPTYPVFFILFGKTHFNFLEKLNLTIIINLSFYILSAYIGFFLGVPITAMFFYLTLIISYLSIIIFIIFRETRGYDYNFLKPLAKIDDIKEFEKFIDKFNIINFIKKNVRTNGFLLIIFLLLICILNVVRFTYFFGTDPFLHIFIIKIIVRDRYLPLEEYYGSVGLPIFGAVIYFFSG
ncbi:MAG: hypothetical protein ACFFHV_19100, partial [Promethearchaeota archaeon]